MFRVSVSSSLLGGFDEPEPSVAQTPKSLRGVLTSDTETRLFLRFEVESVPNEETNGMKRSRFSEEQIIAILKSQESGV
ncbi:hypothetical protein, partial [Tropicimonas sp. IMCC6043]|uniref:hypothetical protein n=1 Tax=Tropicimonas sp. IMCC6043 TaxID=2510645 RepID=UPI001A9252A1